jgi:hypothetical protein
MTIMRGGAGCRTGHCLIIRFVLNLDDRAVAAAYSVDPSRWLGLLDELMLRVGARFRRVEPRWRARAFVLGLLAGLLEWAAWTLVPEDPQALATVIAGLHLVSLLLLYQLYEATGQPPASTLQKLAIMAAAGPQPPLIG